MQNFAFHEPATLAEAVAILREHRGESKVLGGGQSLVLMLHDRILNPAHLVSLQKIEELRGIGLEDDGGLRIGSMVSLRDIEGSALLRERCPLLPEAASKVASVHIRHLGTIGGNLCHSLVGADLPPVILALGARLRIAGASGERVVPAEDFFRGFMETAVDEDEVLVAVHVPPCPPGIASAYVKHCVRAVDPALVGVAAVLHMDGPVCADARIGIGGASFVPVRARGAEGILRGRVPAPDLLLEAGAAAREEVDCIADAHGSAEYRSRMVAVTVRRAVQAALDRYTDERGRGGSCASL